VWQVLLSDVVKDVGTSKPVWDIIYPWYEDCSIGIYFSSALVRVYYSLFYFVEIYFFPVCSIIIYFSAALVRLCYYLIRCCMSLIFVIPSYLLTLMVKTMMLFFLHVWLAQAMTEDCVRYSFVVCTPLKLLWWYYLATPSSWICVCDDLRKCI